MVVGVSACGIEAGRLPTEIESRIVTHASAQTWSSWSEPVNLGPIVNTGANEVNPS